MNVYISVGSNIQPEENIQSAIIDLHERFGDLQLSSVYQNPAIGFEGDDFYNLVVGFETNLTASEIVKILRQIELKHSRNRKQPRFSSRTLDLDLLLFADQIIDEPGLQVPRAEITQYAFVLGPLAELIGDAEHPVENKSYQRLWSEFAGPRELTKVDLRLSY